MNLQSLSHREYKPGFLDTDSCNLTGLDVQSFQVVLAQQVCDMSIGLFLGLLVLGIVLTNIQTRFELIYQIQGDLVENSSKHHIDLYNIKHKIK